MATRRSELLEDTLPFGTYLRVLMGGGFVGAGVVGLSESLLPGFALLLIIVGVAMAILWEDL